MDLWWGESTTITAAIRTGGPCTGAILFCFQPNEGDSSTGTMCATLPVASTGSAAGFAVMILLSGPALAALGKNAQTPGVTGLRQTLDSGATPPVQPLTPAARLAVESIRRCPFGGAFRDWALAARAHDLLLEFLARAPAGDAATALPPGVDARIRAAEEILRQNLADPPALPALARRAGLSETSLKRGFRRVFDDTVFGHLRHLRVQKARALIEAGDCTVLEAATQVGYSNPSNFSAAFRREFGVNPKQFQLAARRR
jgi:AraC-like DNA-binding protein